MFFFKCFKWIIRDLCISKALILVFHSTSHTWFVIAIFLPFFSTVMMMRESWVVLALKWTAPKKCSPPSTTPKVLLARWWYRRGHITITKARVKNVIFDQHTHSFTPRTISPQEDQKWNLTYKNAEKRKQTTFVSRKTR